MCVPFSHFVRLVTRPAVDHSLIDAFRSTVADETVAEDMPASDVFPLAAAQRLAQMVRCFIYRHRILILPSHWIEEVVFGMLFQMVQHFVDFGYPEKKTVPEVMQFGICESAQSYAPFDLCSCLKRRLVRCLWESQILVWERPGHVFHRNRPSPDCAKCAEFFAYRNGAQQLSILALVLRSLDDSCHSPAMPLPSPHIGESELSIPPAARPAMQTQRILNSAPDLPKVLFGATKKDLKRFAPSPYSLLS